MGVAVITRTSAGRSPCLELHPLMHAEAMLFVEHGEPQIRKRKSSGRSHACRPRVDQPLFERSERGRSRSAALASGEDASCTPAALAIAPAPQVLPRKNLRRRHERALAARFDRIEQRIIATTVLPEPTSP